VQKAIFKVPDLFFSRNLPLPSIPPAIVPMPWVGFSSWFFERFVVKSPRRNQFFPAPSAPPREQINEDQLPRIDPFREMYDVALQLI
jgi:hypothetical protein